MARRPKRLENFRARILRLAVGLSFSKTIACVDFPIPTLSLQFNVAVVKWPIKRNFEILNSPFMNAYEFCRPTFIIKFAFSRY